MVVWIDGEKCFEGISDKIRQYPPDWSKFRTKSKRRKIHLFTKKGSAEVRLLEICRFGREIFPFQSSFSDSATRKNTKSLRPKNPKTRQNTCLFRSTAKPPLALLPGSISSTTDSANPRSNAQSAMSTKTELIDYLPRTNRIRRRKFRLYRKMIKRWFRYRRHLENGSRQWKIRRFRPWPRL